MNKTILLISIDSNLLDIVADRDEMMVYNKKKLFLESFIKEVKNQFDDFKPTIIQKILLELLLEEFVIDTYVKSKIIIDHFPIHHNIKTKNILREWK